MSRIQHGGYRRKVEGHVRVRSDVAGWMKGCRGGSVGLMVDLRAVTAMMRIRLTVLPVHRTRRTGGDGRVASGGIVIGRKRHRVLALLQSGVALSDLSARPLAYALDAGKGTLDKLTCRGRGTVSSPATTPLERPKRRRAKRMSRGVTFTILSKQWM